MPFVTCYLSWCIKMKAVQKLSGEITEIMHHLIHYFKIRAEHCWLSFLFFISAMFLKSFKRSDRSVKVRIHFCACLFEAVGYGRISIVADRWSILFSVSLLLSKNLGWFWRNLFFKIFFNILFSVLKRPRDMSRVKVSNPNLYLPCLVDQTDYLVEFGYCLSFMPVHVFKVYAMTGSYV